MKIPSNPKLLVLFFTIVVVMIGFGIVFPVLPFYLDKLGGGGREMGIIVGIYAVTQLLFSPVWGDLSERHGRKPLIVIGVLGVGVSHLMFALAETLWLTYLARALAGVVSAATLPTGLAYISDITSEEERGHAMGWLSGAMGVGVVLGPGLGGLLATDSLTLPFYIAAGLSGLAAVFVMLFLPESLSEEVRRENGARRQGPRPGEMWAALSSPLGIVLLVSFLLSFSLTNLEAVYGLYSVDRFGFTARDVGWVLMFSGVVYAIIPAVLTGPLIKRWGDVGVLRTALLVNGLGFAAMLVPETLAGMALAAAVFVAGNSLLRPVSVSLLSKRTSLSQGVTMGLSNSFNSLGRVVGPLWAGLIYDVDIRLPYISGAGVMFLACLVSLLWLDGKQPAKPSAGEWKIEGFDQQL